MLDIELDFQANTIRKVENGTERKLSRHEILLIEKLVESNGELVKRKELLDCCWEGKIVTDSSLNVAIRHVRLAIAECGSNMLVITLPREGYCIQTKSEGNTAKSEGNTAKSEGNTAKSEGNTAKSEGWGITNKKSVYQTNAINARKSFLIHSGLFFLSLGMLCYGIYSFIMPYKIEMVRGVEVLSFGALPDESYLKILEYLALINATAVYILPNSASCTEVQIIAMVNDDLFDVTSKFKLDSCEYI